MGEGGGRLGAEWYRRPSKEQPVLNVKCVVGVEVLRKPRSKNMQPTAQQTVLKKGRTMH